MTRVDLHALPLGPSRYALDHYESLEGMNVRVGTSRVVGATDPHAELWVTVKPHENASRRGGTVYGSYTAQNTGRLQTRRCSASARSPSHPYAPAPGLMPSTGA